MHSGTHADSVTFQRHASKNFSTAQLVSIIASDPRRNWSAAIQSYMTQLDLYSAHVKVVSISAQESKQAHYSIKKKKSFNNK